MDGLKELVQISRRYGSDSDWVLAGGGNTSYKDSSTLWVKASGTALAAIDASGFCAMDRKKLDAIWSREYPRQVDEREAAVLADLMAARLPGEEKRPSVETLLHGFFPQAYVVHTHPALVNGVTCGQRGEAVFRELFSAEAVWVPIVDPGYVLAKTARKAVEEFRSRTGGFPAFMFLQNHGLLVAADTPQEIERVSGRVLARLGERLARRPDRCPRAVPAGDLARASHSLALRAPEGSWVLHRADADILAFAESSSSFAPLSSAFSPDHIVYAGHEFLRADGPDGIDQAWGEYRERNGVDPRVAAVAGVGAFALAGSRGAAEKAMALFQDACSVAIYSESFGGPLHLTKPMIDFIRNWEVERYRAQASLGSGEGK